MTKTLSSFSLILILTFCLIGCATSRDKRLLSTGLAAVAGAVVGSKVAPENERKELHAMYWAGILGLGTSLISNYVFDETEEVAKYKLETEKLRAELDLIQNARKVMLKEGRGRFKSGNSNEDFFQSGKARWRLYEIDQWVKDGPDRLYHRDKMIELIPEAQNP